MRTLRVRELCRHDRDTYSVNNQQRNLDAISSHIFYEDLYRSYRNDNIRYSLCHRYVTCPRFDRGIFIPSSISLPANLFTHFIIHHLVTNSFVTFLESFLWCVLPRGPRYTTPIHGVTNPNLDPCQLNIHLRRYLLSIFIITQLCCDVWYHTRYSSSIWELHNLIVKGICIWHEESNSNKTEQSIC